MPRRNAKSPRLGNFPKHIPPDTHRAHADIVKVMPGVTVPTPALQPLSADEAAAGERIAARLHADLGRLVAQLPPAARGGGSAMSRHLGIVRNTCQRVAYALQAPPALDTLARLPGVKGLEQMLEAMADKGLPQRDTQLAAAGVAQFDRFIRDHAGSHAKLIARIETPGTDDEGVGIGSERTRQALFEAATAVTGRSAAATISLYAFRPAPTDADTLQRATITGLYRSLVMPGGMPSVIAAGDTLHWADDEQRTLRLPDASVAAGTSPAALLPEFTTQPLPTISSRGQAGNLIQVIDPADLEGPRTIDVFTLALADHPMRHPDTGALTLDEVWSLSNCASEHLVFDVYLHRDLERLVRPAIDAQLWYPNLSAPGGDRWVTRYPGPPRLELLGTGLDRAPSNAWPRHHELTAVMFDRLGWPPTDFVGFRCEVRYPIWRAGYCMAFDAASTSNSDDSSR